MKKMTLNISDETADLLERTAKELGYSGSDDYLNDFILRSLCGEMEAFDEYARWGRFINLGDDYDIGGI